MAFCLQQIYDEHADALYAFLLQYSRQETAVHDALQELFLKLARRPSLLENAREPRAFLLGMALNTFRDGARKQSTRTVYEDLAASQTPEIFEPAPFPSEEAEFRAAVAHGLERLPEEQRAIVHLKLWEELTFQQIADTLGISPHTAASRYRYALDKLRDLLRPFHSETSTR